MRRGLAFILVVALTVAAMPLVSPAAGYSGSDSTLMTGPAESHDFSSMVWANETVDSEGRVGKFSSIVVDGSGTIHISYYYQSNRDLRYARLEPDGTWTTETVHSDGDVGKYTAIAVTDDGTPHIVYYDESGDSLRYATRDGDSWTTQWVDDDLEHELSLAENYVADIAVDSDGIPHIAYFDRDDGRALKYARWNGISWVVETVEDRETMSITTGAKGDLRTDTIDSSVGLYATIAVDENRDPHISYLSEQKKDVNCWWDDDPGSIADGADAVKKCEVPARADTDVKHAEWTGSRWVIDTVSEEGIPSDISLKGADTPVIAIDDPEFGSRGSIKLAEQTDGEWNVVTVISESHGEPQVELDDRGRYHVTYRTEAKIRPGTNGANLRSAWKENAKLHNGTCRSCSSGWQTETVIDDDSQSMDAFNVYQYSFAVDDNGTPHVSYYDEEEQNLKYATKEFALADSATPPKEDCAVCNPDGNWPRTDESLLPDRVLPSNESASSGDSMRSDERESGNESSLIGVSASDTAIGSSAGQNQSFQPRLNRLPKQENSLRVD